MSSNIKKFVTTARHNIAEHRVMSLGFPTPTLHIQRGLGRNLDARVQRLSRKFRNRAVVSEQFGVSHIKGSQQFASGDYRPERVARRTSKL